MNRDEITRMAREAGYGWSLTDMHAPALERFAALVAAAEREACAQVCDSIDTYGDRCEYWTEKAAKLIRSRGEQPKRHPGYIMGDHWLQAAYTRICTGEDVRDVMAEYGWYP